MERIPAAVVGVMAASEAGDAERPADLHHGRLAVAGGVSGRGLRSKTSKASKRRGRIIGGIGNWQREKKGVGED
jgi:hypothetical protein